MYIPKHIKLRVAIVHSHTELNLPVDTSQTKALDDIINFVFSMDSILPANLY